MKKIITLLLTFVMLLSITACGGGNKENTPSNEDKTSGSIQQEEPSSEASSQEEQTSDGEQTDSIATDNSGEETNEVVAPKSPDDPAPLVSRQVEGLTQEQVSEVYKFVYFTMGVPYEDMERAIIDEDIVFYWEELERFASEGYDPYDSQDLYFVENQKVEWPDADYIFPGLVYSGTGKTVKIDNPYTFDKDGYECWRVYIDKASVEEVAAYIELLKENGISFTPTFLIPDELPAGTFDYIGQYEWQGTADYGFYISFLHTEEQTLDFTGTDLTQLIICLYSHNPNE